MLLKKKATKVVAIAAAVLLLLVAAVTGTVLAFRSTPANAITVSEVVNQGKPYVFKIKVPDGVTLYADKTRLGLTEYRGVKFDDIANGTTTIPANSSLDAIGKDTNEDGTSTYAVSVKEEKKEEFGIGYELDTTKVKNISIKNPSIEAGNADVMQSSGVIAFTIENGEGNPEFEIIAEVVPTAKFEYDAAQVTITGAGFSSTTKSMPVPTSGNLTFNATAKEGFSVSEVTYQVDGPEQKPLSSVSEDGASYTYTISDGELHVGDVLKSVTINITAETKKLNVNYTPSSNVMYAPENSSTVDYNSPLTFSVSFATGYTVGSVYVLQGGTNGTNVTVNPQDGNPQDGKYTYTTGSITKDPVSVNVTATNAKYKVTFSSDGEGYTIYGANETATYGTTSYTFNVTAKAGYTIEKVEAKIGGGENIAEGGNGGSYIIRGDKITGDITITVTAKPAKYWVTYDGGNNVEAFHQEATYSESGSDYFEFKGSNALKALFGYEISTLTYTVAGAGSSRNAAERGTDGWKIPRNKITGDITLFPTASGKTYDVTFTGENVSHENVSTAAYGSTYTFQLTANSGYKIDSVAATVNGVISTVTSGSDGKTYSLPVEGRPSGGSETKKVEITVSASPISRTVTFTGGNYSHTGNTNATIADDYKFTVTPNDGYDLDSVKYSVGGAEAENLIVAGGGGNSYTIPKDKITDNITITVTLMPKTYTVTVGASIDNQSVDENGISDKFTVTPELSATHGKDLSFTVSAQDGYSVSSVMATVNGVAQTVTPGGNGSYAIAGSLVSGNIVITIEGHEFAYTIKYNDSHDTTLTSETLKWSDQKWGDGTYNLPGSKEYYNRTWSYSEGGRPTRIGSVEKNTIKSADASIDVTAAWSLNETKVAELLEFKVEYKNGDNNKLWIHLTSGAGSWTQDGEKWTEFLTETGGRSAQLRAIGLTLAAIQSGEKNGVTLVEANRNKENYAQRILAGLSADDVTTKSALAQCTMIQCREESDNLVTAYGVCFDNASKWFNFTLASSADKLQRRAIAFWALVEVDGALEIVSGDFKMVSDWISSALPIEVAILPEEISEHESYEEPTIE